MFDNRTIDIGAKFGVALGRIDQNKNAELLAKMIGTLSGLNSARLALVKTGSAMALGKVNDTRDAAVLEAALHHFVARGREGLADWDRLFSDLVVPSGLSYLIANTGREILQSSTIEDLPAHDLCVLQDAGLTDEEAVNLLNQGLSRGPEIFAEVEQCQDLYVYMSGLVSQARRGLNELERNGSDGVAVLFSDSDEKKERSAGEKLFSYIKILSGAVIIAADFAGAAPTAGAAVLSVAGGAGLAADGAGEVAKEDLD